jgi:hypothetical protein
MSRADRLDRWRRAVFTARPGMTSGCRVLLLRLLEDMNRDGIVSVPRSKLAAELGVAPARITERVKLARALGFLDVVRRARPKVTAVYQATIPACSEVRPPVPLSGPDSVPLKGGSEIQMYPTQVGTTPRESERLPGDHGPDVRSYEGHLDTPSRYGLTACDCHGFTDCATLRNHRETA